MGGSSSSEEQKGFGYDTHTHPPAGICFKNGEPCQRDKYDEADDIGGCCEGQSCLQVSFTDPDTRKRGYYFCMNSYTGEYDNTAADNACATSNFLGISWCNMGNTATETSVGNVCSDHDDLIAELSFGKITSCKDALKAVEEHDLSCVDMTSDHILEAMSEGLVDPSINTGDTHSFIDICCETCSSGSEIRTLGFSQDMADSMIGNEAGEITILVLAIVGVVAIVSKIFNACVQKEGYTGVPDKTVEEEI